MVSDVVKITIGSNGWNVVIHKADGLLRISKDGVIVGKTNFKQRIKKYRNQEY